MMRASAGAPAFAPQPLNQPILPGWLFAGTVNVTEENSASPETERHIVAAHSYGQQLGRILDVVNDLIAERPADAPGLRSIREFEQLWRDIESIKAQSAAQRIEQAIADLARMKQQHPGEYRRLAAMVGSVLDEQPGAGAGAGPRPTRA
jgi:hypothetical protein